MGNASLADDGYHIVMIIGYCPMKPEKKDIAVSIMNAELPNLAKTCDAEMLAKAQKLMLKQHETNLKTNGYWMNAINNYRKLNVDTYSDYVKVVQAQTPQSISAFVNEFLKANSSVSVIMMPKE
jgi:zinc protease